MGAHFYRIDSRAPFFTPKEVVWAHEQLARKLSYKKHKPTAGKINLPVLDPYSKSRKPDRLKAPDVKLDAEFTGRPSVALLFTPSFAHLLNNESNFVHTVISTSLRGVERGAHVDVLAAIVDAIPAPDSVICRHEELYKDSEAGADGLSACLISSAQINSPWDSQSSQLSQPEHDLPGRLSFLVETPIRDGAEPSVDMAYQVTLPLPNTVFQNGELQTLKALSYEVSSIGPDHTPQMKLRSAQNLLSCALRLDSGKLRALAGLSSENSLAPLTQFRRVAESMGNILRRLEDINSKDGQITASFELETSLRQWKERPFEIWAEIVPYNQWQNNPDEIDKLPLISRLEQGHRFARILSGGGGWGARAGLLSLDPETIPYKNPDTSSVKRDDSELPFALPDLVRKGDFIRYLLAPSPFSERSDQIETTIHLEPPKFPSSTVYEFGSGIRQEAEDEEAPTPESGEAVFTTSFGALSRKPASVEIGQTITRNSPAAHRQQKDLVQTLLPPRATLGFG